MNNKISLNFYGPIPMSDFSKTCPPKSEYPGVYIWGFLNNGKFIPYYVGKHQTSIFSRISTHLADIKKNTSTYMRLTKSYMEGLDGITPFYSDTKFPLISGNWKKTKLPQWFKQNESYFFTKVSYMNNKEFFEIHDLPIKLEINNNYPICNMNNIDDYLKENISTLHVMYAPCIFHDKFVIKNKRQFYEIVEAYVKYCLKGKTVSKSLPFEKLCNSLCIDIFTDFINVNIFKELPSKIFVGY